MQYQQIIFSRLNNFFDLKLSVFAIFPNQDIPALLSSSWFTDIADNINQMNNEELKIKIKQDLNILRNRWVNALGNLAMIDDFKLNKGYKVERKNGIENFIIEEGDGDFSEKKKRLANCKFQDLYQIVINAKFWNKDEIQAQTRYLANLFVECFNNDNIGDK